MPHFNSLGLEFNLARCRQLLLSRPQHNEMAEVERSREEAVEIYHFPCLSAPLSLSLSADSLLQTSVTSSSRPLRLNN